MYLDRRNLFMVNKGTRLTWSDTVIYIFLFLVLIYLAAHVVYAFVREDSSFRNPEQFFTQPPYHSPAYVPIENERLFDETALNYPVQLDEHYLLDDKDNAYTVDIK